MECHKVFLSRLHSISIIGDQLWIVKPGVITQSLTSDDLLRTFELCFSQPRRKDLVFDTVGQVGLGYAVSLSCVMVRVQRWICRWIKSSGQFFGKFPKTWVWQAKSGKSSVLSGICLVINKRSVLLRKGSWFIVFYVIFTLNLFWVENAMLSSCGHHFCHRRSTSPPTAPPMPLMALHHLQHAGIPSCYHPQRRIIPSPCEVVVRCGEF